MPGIHFASMDLPVPGGPVISMGNLVAVVSGALCMMALGKWVVPKHPKLAEYSLGIAMLFGIACALILT